MEQLFKIGVSDWKLFFQGGEIVDFLCVLEQTVKISADGKKSININNVSFDEKFVKLFESKNKLDKIFESFYLYNSSSEIVSSVDYAYEFPKISNVKIHSKKDGVATLSLSITCK